MAKEISLRVAEAKPSDAGKARINPKIMKTLNLKAGDIIEVKGKKRTVAIARPAYRDVPDVDIIRIPLFVRKNAGVDVNECVTIAKADVEEAESVLLAPLDMHLNVDTSFENFVKTRLFSAGAPVLKGDSLSVEFLGTRIPFKVLRVKPQEIGTVSMITELKIRSEPELSPDARTNLLEQMRNYRFAWLKSIEKHYAADYAQFRVSDCILHKNEEPALKQAKQKAKDLNKTVSIFVDLWENRGKIVSLNWALASPNGEIEYNYEKKFPPFNRHLISSMDTIGLIMSTLKEHEKRFDKINQQLESITKKFKLRNGTDSR